MVEENVKKALAENIHNARMQSGLTREELAEKVHAHVTTVTAWENGVSVPHEKKRILLSEILGIDIKDLNNIGHSNNDNNKNIVYINGDIPPFEMINSASEILKKTKNFMNIIRMNKITEDSRLQLKPYYDIFYKSVLDDNVTINVVECIYDKERIKEIISNIIFLDGYNYYIKVIPYRIQDFVTPLIDMYMSDDKRLILSGFSASRNVHEKPKVFAEEQALCDFFSNYWASVWDRAIPLNYLGAMDLSAIEALAKDFDMSDEEFHEAELKAERMKAEGRAQYLI